MSLQRIFLSIACLSVVGIGGCAQSPRYSSSEVSDGLSRVNQCLAKYAQALDDKISPADTVAVGVAAACRGEIDSYDNMRVPNNGTHFSNSFYANRHQGWHKSAVLAVLMARKK